MSVPVLVRRCEAGKAIGKGNIVMVMASKTLAWDATDYVKTDADIAENLAVALEIGEVSDVTLSAKPKRAA
jgi:hypothetical protein